MSNIDRYIFKRGRKYVYIRRVPTRVIQLGEIRRIQRSLKTESIELARKRRDDFERADEEYWAKLLAGTGNVKGELARYERARNRALASGFRYLTADQLAENKDVSEILDRIAYLEKQHNTKKSDVDALLGTVKTPSVTLDSAFNIFVNEIASEENRTKSERQFISWRKVKKRAVKNFQSVVGQRNIDEITRADALKFYDWWSCRVRGVDGSKPLSGNSANRDLGNMRSLYREYYKRVGDGDRLNPFRDLSFSDPKALQKDTPPFSADWIVNKIMHPHSLQTLNRDAALIVLCMIETGCRPSEICNISEEAIHLDAAVPHISIRYQEKRELKTYSSVREIPLVGVSLLAFQRAPGGFKRYLDKENSLSAVLMKHFRKMGLFPSSDYRIYSIRHSFEKRMQEAGLDYALRCTLMGHAVDRPEYGDGGSLIYRRNQMLKFALPVHSDLSYFLRTL